LDRLTALRKGAGIVNRGPRISGGGWVLQLPIPSRLTGKTTSSRTRDATRTIPSKPASGTSHARTNYQRVSFMYLTGLFSHGNLPRMDFRLYENPGESGGKAVHIKGNNHGEEWCISKGQRVFILGDSVPRSIKGYLLSHPLTSKEQLICLVKGKRCFRAAAACASTAISGGNYGKRSVLTRSYINR